MGYPLFCECQGVSTLAVTEWDSVAYLLLTLPLNTEREERKGALILLSITLPLPPPKNDD